MRLFCGYDEREDIGYRVFVSSVLKRASVDIRRIDSCGLPAGSNHFTLSRFLVPHLCERQGWAVFADASDMVCLEDITQLGELFDQRYAVQVVKHAYKTRHQIKYVGTDMACPNRDYPRKNWASLMLINCEHPSWSIVTPELLGEASLAYVMGLGFLQPEEIGELPDKWNRLVDEGQPVDGAAILHFTAGIPAFEHYANTPGADIWRSELETA